jgi:DoxX-like family
LGYPLYVLAIIGVWKLLATIALLAPRFPLLKEWAYAGSFFVFSGAVASHIAAGDGFGHWIGPGIGAAVPAVSWALRPPSRRISGLSISDPSGDLRLPTDTGKPIATNSSEAECGGVADHHDDHDAVTAILPRRPR